MLQCYFHISNDILRFYYRSWRDRFRSFCRRMCFHHRNWEIGIHQWRRKVLPWCCNQWCFLLSSLLDLGLCSLSWSIRNQLFLYFRCLIWNCFLEYHYVKIQSIQDNNLIKYLEVMIYIHLQTSLYLNKKHYLYHSKPVGIHHLQYLMIFWLINLKRLLLSSTNHYTYIRQIRMIWVDSNFWQQLVWHLLRHPPHWWVAYYNWNQKWLELSIQGYSLLEVDNDWRELHWKRIQPCRWTHLSLLVQGSSH